MKNAKLIQLLAMIMASSTMGARGLACIGDCSDRTDHQVIPLLPAASGDNGGPVPSDSTAAACAKYCPHSDSCKATTIGQPDGTGIPAIECESHYTCGAGRRPVGLAELNIGAPSTMQQWFAQTAHLEAASVDAFRLLRRDLRAHGAPRALLRQASRAAREERRHARRMRALAKRAKVNSPVPVVVPTPVPSFEELVCHNAIEGGIRESFGALVALYQAHHAQDREVAAAMKKIAREEANHAALSWRISEWARPRLTSEAKQRVDMQTQAAAHALLRDAESAVDIETRRILGLPDACTSFILAKKLLAHSV